jgi:UDP-N-acetylmuramoylalanine--D-glutamate ligase
MPAFSGQHFAILGAGRSGLGAARLARSQGAEVTVFDEGDPSKIQASVEKLKAEGFRTTIGQEAKDFQVKPGAFQRVIISPGLDEGWPLPKKFTDAGTHLEGETEFAFQLTDMPMVAITGTNGKSTCTELVAHIFEANGQRSLPCGNHGVSLSEVVASGVRYDVLSLEVSSFQLETIRTFRAKASLWLNFAPDHLDRYPGMGEYFAAKSRIFENVMSDDVAIIRAGESVSSGPAKRLTFSAYGAEAHASYSQGEFWVKGQLVGSATQIRLRGRHNMENILAAMLACEVHGVACQDALRAIASYEPPKHRCELVHEWNEREYINDSKATNLHALEACIGAMERPIVLIAGGKEKGLDYTPLRAALNGQVRAMVLIGEIKQALHDTFSDLLPCQIATDMDEAVKLATELSHPGDSIILSPGTSSFDMYTGYGHRGDAFRAAAQAIR